MVLDDVVVGVSGRVMGSPACALDAIGQAASRASDLHGNGLAQNRSTTAQIGLHNGDGCGWGPSPEVVVHGRNQRVESLGPKCGYSRDFSASERLTAPERDSPHSMVSEGGLEPPRPFGH